MIKTRKLNFDLRHHKEILKISGSGRNHIRWNRDKTGTSFAIFICIPFVVEEVLFTIRKNKDRRRINPGITKTPSLSRCQMTYNGLRNNQQFQRHRRRRRSRVSTSYPSPWNRKSSVISKLNHRRWDKTNYCKFPHPCRRCNPVSVWFPVGAHKTQPETLCPTLFLWDCDA